MVGKLSNSQLPIVVHNYQISLQLLLCMLLNSMNGYGQKVKGTFMLMSFYKNSLFIRDQIITQHSQPFISNFDSFL
jgi:hypothetical protein